MSQATTPAPFTEESPSSSNTLPTVLESKSTTLEQRKAELKQLFLDRVSHAGKPSPRGLSRRDLYRMRVAETNGQPIDNYGVIDTLEPTKNSDDVERDPDEADKKSR